MSLHPPMFWKALPLLLLLAGPARAHDPFESTVVSRLQHGRLEVVLTMSTQLGGVLVQDPARPDAPGLGAGPFEDYRERLETRARTLYTVTGGGTALVPLRTAAALTKDGHVEVALIYPRPPAWPLRFRAQPVAGLPPGFTADFEVFDEDEKLLGRKFITAANLATAELSIDPAQPAPAQVAPTWMAPAPVAPEVVPPVAQAVPRPLGLRLGLGLALALGAAVLAIRFFHKPPRSAP